MNKLLQDIRYGFRMLVKSPGFAVVAILTLALGIGANTAIFSLIDAVMLRALPVENPSQLMLLKWTARHEPDTHGYMSSGDCADNLGFGENAAKNPSGCSLSEPFFRKIEKSGMFSSVTAFANSGRLDLTGNGPAAVINGQLVSGDFFRTMGVKAAAGRLFQPSDDRDDAAPVAVLNYGYWQSAFGGSRDAIGRTIELNNIPFTIIGVAEARFTGITPGSDYDVWLPLDMGERINPRQQIIDRLGGFKRQDDVATWWLTIIGRMKPDVSVAQTQTAVSNLFYNEMIHGAVPLFNGGAMGGGPGGPGGPAGGGMVMRMVGGPPPGGRGGNAPIGMSPAPQSAGNKPVIIGGPQQMAAGKGMIQTGRPAPAGGAGQMAQSAGNKPVIIGGPQPGAPAGGPNGANTAESANHGPRTLSNASDDPRITLVPAQSGLNGDRGRFSDPLYVLMLAVGIILLIACANVAGLMLARAAARQKEIAVRLALGAGRTRVIRQLLTESVLLSVLGGILGICFAYWGAHAIVSFVSSNQTRPLAFALGVDTRMLGFTIAVSLFTGILFGIAPSLRSARVDLTPALKEGEGGSSSGGHAGGGRWFGIFRLGNGLVVAQVALAIVVLVGAGLLVRTLENLRSVDVGFDVHNIIIFGIDPTLAGYKDTQIDSFYRDLQGRLAATPGVKAVSYSQGSLLSGGLTITGFHWPGTPQDQVSEADVLQVGPDFFDTLHIPFLAGRNFYASDYAVADTNGGATPSSAPTPVIVNQAFVEKYLGKENPLGKQFGEAPADANGPANPGYEIVGIVADTKYNNLRRDIHAMMYQPQRRGGASFEVRTAADPQALLPLIRKVVAEVNANLPLFNVTTESEQIDRLLFQERLIARLSSFFGLLALILACIGLYGLLSYEVSRRTREIGIRMALGAQAGDVLRMVVKQGIVLALVGAAVGIGAALGVTHYLSSMLYGVRSNDPVTIIAVAVLLTLVALAACYIPARRATEVDPIVALRYE